jgi:hypothetical protein
MSLGLDTDTLMPQHSSHSHTSHTSHITSSAEGGMSVVKKRKAFMDVPDIVEYFEDSMDKEDAKLFKRVKLYIKNLEKKNNELESQQKSLMLDPELPDQANTLLEKYAGSFTSRNQGQESLEWIMKLVVKDTTIRYDHKMKDTKLSKVAFLERKEHYLDRGFAKVDKVLDAVMKKKKSRAIATVKGHSKRIGYVE